MFVNANSSLSISWWVLAGSGSSRDPTKETQVTRDPLFLQPPLRLARQGRLLWSGLVLSRVQSVCWWGSGGKGGRSGSFRLPCSDSSMTERYHISHLQRHTRAIRACGDNCVVIIGFSTTLSPMLVTNVIMNVWVFIESESLGVKFRWRRVVSHRTCLACKWHCWPPALYNSFYITVKTERNSRSKQAATQR